MKKAIILCIFAALAFGCRPMDTPAPPKEQSQDKTDDTAATETKPPVLFTGNLTLIITPDSPLFGSVYVKLDIYNESGDKLGSTLTLCPQLRITAGYKAVTIKPNEQGMTLYRWQTYTLRVYDANGNSSTASVTPSFAGGFTVHV